MGARVIKDKQTIRAQQEGLRARSAYKLKELQKKYQFLNKAIHVLDLGCWPGGWSIVAAKYAPVTAVDITFMKAIPNVTFIQEDLFEKKLLEQLPAADVVLSDAAPKTVGDSRDQYISYLLCMRALEIALHKLRTGGSLIVKIFQGEDFEKFLLLTRKYFSFVKCTKPPTSKNSSKEMYVVAMGYTPREQSYEEFKKIFEEE